jgi:hypothetical protein
VEHAPAVVSAAPAARRPAPPIIVAKRAKPLVVKPAPLRNGHDKGKTNGFALNLTNGGADQRDAEFERM